MRYLSAYVVAAMLCGALPAQAQLAPPNEIGITYGHVHVTVKDLELHKKLWVEHFGGTVVQKGTLTAVKLPNMLIAFRVAESTGPSQGSTVDHFGFRVRDIEAVKTKWRAAGYQVTQEFTGAEGAPNAYLMGPDQIRLEVQEDKTLNVVAAANHVHLWTVEHAKLLDWYVDVFKAVKRKRGNIDTTADVPGLNLSFATVKEPTVGTKGRAIDHIGFEVDNLQEFCKKLEAKGIKFDIPYREVPAIGLKIAYITDPVGTYIELTEGYDAY